MGFKLGSMTFGGLFKKPETLLYPFETKTPPAGLKGTIKVDVDNCILCGICQKKCPCGTIVVDKPNRVWKINHYQCIQCGYCVRECPKGGLTMEPVAPPAATTFGFEVFEVPDPKAAKEEKTADAPVIEPTGDPEMDAKLAGMDPEKAAKVRAAFMAKKAKEAADA
jgi:ech hydrogenase subunit F